MNVAVGVGRVALQLCQLRVGADLGHHAVFLGVEDLNEAEVGGVAEEFVSGGLPGNRVDNRNTLIARKEIVIVVFAQQPIIPHAQAAHFLNIPDADRAVEG